jgi:hypothetical protein
VLNGRSFTYNINKMGPTTETWGTLCLIALKSDVYLSDTCLVLSV